MVIKLVKEYANHIFSRLVQIVNTIEFYVG